MKNDGWSVYMDERGRLELYKGMSVYRSGVTFLAWTAGNKVDGRALLAEEMQKRGAQ